MEMKPNLNLNIEVHQATHDKSLNLTSLNCQFFITFNNLQLSSKSSNSPSPVWNESFNFEYKDSLITLSFFHNPLFLKEILLGQSTFPAKDCTGWFDIKNACGKIGSVRITIKLEGFLSKTDDEYKFKILQLQIVVDELKRVKEKYQKKLKRLEKGGKTERTESKVLDLDSSVNDLSLLAKIKYQLKVKEEGLAEKKAEIENSWKGIEEERKNLSLMYGKIQVGCLDLRNVRERLGKAEVFTPATCPRTPMSAKYSNLSDLSLTQPRSGPGVDSEHFLSTPKSKLINFD